MVEHTPGPWSIGGASGNEGEAREIASESRCVAWTASTWDDDEGDVVTAEDDANARLIAAAPELLAALKSVIALIEKDYGGFDAIEEWQEAHAAIAKAEGRSE